ncbi:unnamed protein product [Symbiodinium pilosum]|uniref:Uncharacterized protein n=1 Tax=Symbiodinium pilosum TaxID=2952 RepID=A0A812W006_SYMPI|nr:unnamed protein product [Symbiodinium pilosum]
MMITCRQDIAKLEARKAALEAQEVVLDSLSQQVQKRVKDRARKLEEEEREQQRQEELKRKRQEEEQRCEEERQAEKRRKQLEWQAQEQRGPRIWAQCAAKDHLLKNFDRTALQVALGQSGYITLWDYVKGHAWCGIPTRLYNKLNGRGYHQSHAKLVALSPDSDAFYVQFSDGDCDWFSYSAESFRQALNDSSTPSVVALGPRRAWYVGWPDGRWQSNGLPRSLLNMLNSNRHRSVAFMSISGLDISSKDDDSRDSDDDSRSPSEDEAF